MFFKSWAYRQVKTQFCCFRRHFCTSGSFLRCTLAANYLFVKNCQKCPRMQASTQTLKEWKSLHKNRVKITISVKTYLSRPLVWMSTWRSWNAAWVWSSSHRTLATWLILATYYYSGFPCLARRFARSFFSRNAWYTRAGQWSPSAQGQAHASSNRRLPAESLILFDWRAHALDPYTRCNHRYQHPKFWNFCRLLVSCQIASFRAPTWLSAIFLPFHSLVHSFPRLISLSSLGWEASVTSLALQA